MAKLIFTDFASSTLPSAINETVDTFDISATVIGSFPAPGSGEAFICTLRNSAAGYQNNRELILVEGRTDNTLSTITRSYAGTSPPTGGWPSGTVIIHDVSASFLNDVFQRSAHTMDDISDGTTYVKSTNDFTSTEKSKLEGIAENATANTGDVTAAAAFAADNVLVKSDGTGKGTQASGIIVDDDNNVSGVAQLTAAAVVMAISAPRTAANTGRAITNADFGKNLVVTDGSSQTFTLPSVGESDDGKYFYMTKKGAGNIILGRSDTDTIGPSADTSITMTTAGKKYRLEYSHADTSWEIETFGVWDTTP